MTSIPMMDKELFSIQTQFKYVVDESKKWSQWESRHKYSHKPILNHFLKERKKRTLTEDI
jgi:hypothetical protein